jgi:hypothetical protein
VTTAPVRWSRNPAVPITTRKRNVKTESGPPEEYTRRVTMARSPRIWIHASGRTGIRRPIVQWKSDSSTAAPTIR